MTVRDRVYSAFKESFDLDDETNTSKLVYQAYPAWTSIGHMILVAALEIGIRYDVGDGRHSRNEQFRKNGIDHGQIRQ